VLLATPSQVTSSSPRIAESSNVLACLLARSRILPFILPIEDAAEIGHDSGLTNRGVAARIDSSINLDDSAISSSSKPAILLITSSRASPSK